MTPTAAAATATPPAPATSNLRPVTACRGRAAGGLAWASAGPCSRIRSSRSWSENLVITVTPVVVGGRGPLAQPGARPEQPHPDRAGREPERGGCLLRSESRDIDQFDHRTVPFRQHGQLVDEVPADSFGI